jgi:hypothetical protein
LELVSQWDLQVSLELLQHYERQVVSELVAQVQQVLLELAELVLLQKQEQQEQQEQLVQVFPA